MLSKQESKDNAQPQQEESAQKADNEPPKADGPTNHAANGRQKAPTDTDNSSNFAGSTENTRPLSIQTETQDQNLGNTNDGIHTPQENPHGVDGNSAPAQAAGT